MLVLELSSKNIEELPTYNGHDCFLATVEWNLLRPFKLSMIGRDQLQAEDIHSLHLVNTSQPHPRY